MYAYMYENQNIFPLFPWIYYLRGNTYQTTNFEKYPRGNFHQSVKNTNFVFKDLAKNYSKKGILELYPDFYLRLDHT